MQDAPRRTADELIALVREAEARSREMLEDLDEEQLKVPCTENVNPFLWEFGHIAFFYEIFLLRELDGIGPLQANCDDLYDSFTVHHDDRWGLDLPCRDEAREYGALVRRLVCERLDGREPDARECYHYGLATRHEDMHAEAFTMMRQTLEYALPRLGVPSRDESEAREGAPSTSSEASLAGDVALPGGRFVLGARPGRAFAFDNERGPHEVELAPFSIARTPVTCGQFAEFVSDGGYRRPDLWTRQGWQWRGRTGAQHPRAWRRTPGGWLRMHFDHLLPLDEHHPVSQVNWYEADAYCRWAGRRLPTEAEWEYAATREPGDPGAKRLFPWGDEPPETAHANLDWFARGCADVRAHAAGDTADGLRQMIGNVWEWTSSDFYPYPGFLIERPYIQYSAPWFGYRKVLRGGSWATRSRLITSTYRNFFLPHRNDVFAGLRTCAL